MNRLFSQRFAIIMLVIFITNASIWNMNSNRLTHEIQHSTQSMTLASAVDQGDASSLMAEGKNSDSSNVIEHQQLHAVDHLDIFLAIFPEQYSFPKADLTLFPFFHKVLAMTMAEAPFRPPRLNFRLNFRLV